MRRSAELAPATVGRLAAATGLAWVVAGLQLQLLFDLKATATTIAALVVLTAAALRIAGRPGLAVPILGGVLGAAIVFAAFVIQPALAFVVLALVLVALGALLARPLPETGWPDRLALAAGFAVVIWPPLLGLVSNAVVELACPDGGVEAPCHGFYRVGF